MNAKGGGIVDEDTFVFLVESGVATVQSFNISISLKSVSSLT